MIIMASASGTPVPAIARLVAADEDTVRDVIHAFNERGLAALDPQWAGGRPRLISDDDIAFIVTTATTRPAQAGRPFTHWSVRKLAAYLADNPTGGSWIGRERLRQILREHRITLPADPDLEGVHRPGQGGQAGPDRGGHQPTSRSGVSRSTSSGRCRSGRATAPPGHRESKPVRLPATYHRTHGIRYFHGCYSLGDDQLWGVNRRRKGGDHTLAALKSIRAARPDGAPIYVIMDNLSANKTPAIRAWAARNKVELCLTPTNASWANPIEAQFGPLRTFTMGDSDHPNHTVAGPPAAGLPALAQRQRPPPRRPGRPTPRTRPRSAANANNAGADHEPPHDQPGERSWSTTSRRPSPCRPTSGRARRSRASPAGCPADRPRSA